MENESPDLPQGAFPFTTQEIAQRIEHYAVESLAGKSGSTEGTYRRCLAAFLDWMALQGGRCNLDREDIQAYVIFLSEERGILPASMATYLTAIRSFCQYLTRIGVLRYNPVTGIKGRTRPSSHSRGVLKHDEIGRLLVSIDDANLAGKRDLAMIKLMAFAGLSGIEVVRADVVDMERTLYGSFLNVQGKGRSEKDQRVSLETRVVEAIEGYLAERGPHQPYDPMFVSLSNGRRNVRLSARGLRSCLHHRLVGAGLKREGISAHSLTHAAPLIWLRQGMTVEEVCLRMRHGTRATTLIHARKLDMVPSL